MPPGCPAGRRGSGMGRVEPLTELYTVAARDFAAAGEASSAFKRTLRKLGVDSQTVRQVAVAAYEVEMNMVIHSQGGDLQLMVSPDEITLVAQDSGPGIADVDAAMREGFSTASDDVRTMGFGAGMGLPNMKRNADRFEIQSELGVGTRIVMRFGLRG